MKTNLQTRVETSTRLNRAKRAIKMLSILMVAAMTTFTACTDYDNSLNNAEDRLDNVEQKIPTIGEQIESIKKSISTLNDLQSSLETLAGRVDNTYNKTEIDNLKGALEKKIEDLQDYVNKDFKDGKGIEEWANATFATLEQYTEIQGVLATIKTHLENYESEITKAIEEAIAASEEAMKGWVNERLAEGYYNIADIDAKLYTLETTDASLQEQINAQREALEQAKEELTKAYEEAIKTVIENNNGIITEAIASAVQSVIDDVNSELQTIKNDISAIQKEMENIKNKINSIDKQIESINNSISRLEEADKTLEGFIDNLRKKATDLQNQIDANNNNDVETKKELNSVKALINTLEAKDIELDKKIADLKTYVDNEIASSKNWANATFATLEQYETLQTTIAEIRTLIDTYKNEITKDYTKAIEEAIAASEESMKGWVNELLAEGYYNIADIDAKLYTLETTDASLQEQINAQREALEQAKADLTSAYEEAIESAIEENNGVINTQIAEAVQNVIDNVNSELQTIKDDISAIQEELATLKENFASRIQSIRFLPEYSDGMVMFSAFETTAEISFIISPSNLAAVVANAHSDANLVVTAWISRTLATRAVDMPVALTVISVEGTESGLLTVGVDTSSLAEDYWDSFHSANMFIRIQDGNNDVISEMIPVGFDNE